MNKNEIRNTIIATVSILMVTLIIVACWLMGKINALEDTIEKMEDRIISLEQFKQQVTGVDTSAFDVISMSEVKKLSDGKTIVVWIGLDTCGYCQAYSPIIASVSNKYGITTRYVDASTMTDEDYNILSSLEGVKGWENYGSSFTGTPFTMIIKDNKIIGGINGYVEADYIEEAFNEAGIRK